MNHQAICLFCKRILEVEVSNASLKERVCEACRRKSAEESAGADEESCE